MGIFSQCIISFILQKARQARIRMAKNASGAAFLNSKKRAEEMMLAQESGLDMRDGFSDQDIFNMQHHHLLNCLEKTTVSKEVSIKNKLLISFYIKTLPLTRVSQF